MENGHRVRVIDFFYLPVTSRTDVIGYAFINFVDTRTLWFIVATFVGDNSDKICMHAGNPRQAAMLLKRFRNSAYGKRRQIQTLVFLLVEGPEKGKSAFPLIRQPRQTKTRYISNNGLGAG
jgi:hypothetical protein